MNIRLGTLEMSLSRYLGLWVIVIMVFAMQGCVGDVLLADVWSPLDYLRWAGIQWLAWAALVPVVFRLAERDPLGVPLRTASIARHVGYSIGLTWVALLAGAFVSSVFEPGGFWNQLAQFAGKHFAIGVLAYWMLLAVQHALQLQAERAQRELEASRMQAELARSRLQVLRSQLQPHFLFNTLHAIVTLMEDDALSAEDMLLRLSELLRAFLEDYDGQEITLRQELELLDLYLGIQRRRFGDRLTTRIHVAPDVLDAAVPSLVLQPLVENAISHGIGRNVGADVVEVDCRREGDALCIDVRNGNSTLEQTPERGHGIGMSNTHLRLQELYGEAATLRLDMLFPRGVACRMRLPYRVLEDECESPEHVEGLPA